MGIDSLKKGSLIGPGSSAMIGLLHGIGALIGPDGGPQCCVPAGIKSLIGPGARGMGPQLLLNPEFTLRTIGAEAIPDSGFDSPAAWGAGGNWAIASSQATHTGGASSNLTYGSDVLTIGHCYLLSVDLITYTEDGDIEFSGRAYDGNRSFSGATGINTAYAAATGGSSPTRPTIRDKNSTTGTAVIDDFSNKEVTLNNWAVVGTRGLTEFLIYDGDTDNVRIVSGGPDIGISQDIGVTGSLYYEVIIDEVDSGAIEIATATDGSLVTFSSPGAYSGNITTTDSTIILQSQGACDVGADTINLYKVL